MELDFDNLSAIRILGRGATGTVFLAADQSSPTTPPFALKVVEKNNPAAKPDADRLARARRELSVHSLLLSHPHPFLPHLIGRAENSDLLAFAIPFCPAGDLDSLRRSLSPDRVFSTSAIRFYLSQLVSALSKLHSLGVVYRDLKPENVLIQSSGHVLLTDFDLSRHLPAHTVSPFLVMPLRSSRSRWHCRNLHRIFFAGLQLGKAKSVKVSPVSRQRTVEILVSDSTYKTGSTNKAMWGYSSTRTSNTSGLERSHSFVGTEEYVSPEVVRGDGHDSAVDWWALGILAFEMAYGRTPFKGRNRRETFRNVLTMKPEFVGMRPSGLTDLIARLLAKEPELRLGYLGGAEEVKTHPFFDGLRWEMLADVGRPPFLATAEEIEEGEVRLPIAGFDVRDYFKKLRQKNAVTTRSPASMSLTEF